MTAAAAGLPPRRAPADGASGPDGAALAGLAATTTGWLARNLERFDPYSASAQPATLPQAKAILELALLCHCTSRPGTAGDCLGAATALLTATWRNPDFPRLLSQCPPRLARQYTLIATALAPDGGRSERLLAAAAELTAGGHLSAAGKSPYIRLETRYYADKAGIAHDIEPYRDLIGRSIIVDQPRGFPLTVEEAYTLTHTSFYITDFGQGDAGLAAGPRARAETLLRRVLRYAVAEDQWDLVAELLLAWACLGGDPAGSRSGWAALASLARAQLPDGAIPGRSAATRATSAAGTAEFFSAAYHTTLVTALMSLIIGAGPGPRPSREGK
jgi:hypothetical protein